MVIEPKKQELRRHPRLRVSWPAIVEAGSRLLHVETVDVSPFGAKVRLDERLEEGTLATLHLRPPDGKPLDIQAIVWRTDEDGPAFFFIEPVPTVVEQPQ
ncbi:MAG TPA: PilZ domain-containing protein [Methylomirabilota bacterium]|nr:PilZ domain-containing protein [Methylomirabilota bacterium]